MDIASTTLAAQSASTQNAASAQLTANFDTFLTLLTTQLQNQDPLDPLDTEKFTEQLVQFSAVEQSIQTNEHLQALIALQTSSANETALAMVGKFATVNSDTATLGANNPAQWTVDLPQTAASATARIIDANGATVREFALDPAKDSNIVEWRGALADGAQAPDGQYRLAVTATDAGGATSKVNVSAYGRVDAAAFGADGASVELGGKLFPVSLVRRVDAAS